MPIASVLINLHNYSCMYSCTLSSFLRLRELSLRLLRYVTSGVVDLTGIRPTLTANSSKRGWAEACLPCRHGPLNLWTVGAKQAGRPWVISPFLAFTHCWVSSFRFMIGRRSSTIHFFLSTYKWGSFMSGFPWNLSHRLDHTDPDRRRFIKDAVFFSCINTTSIVNSLIWRHNLVLPEIRIQIIRCQFIVGQK